MLSGAYEHTLDDKGRVSLPAKHRMEMGDMLVLWLGLDGQINVYPQALWETAAENVTNQNQALKSARDLARIFYFAAECQVDRQGRILIPPTLRNEAEIETDVLILGIRDHVEIWGQARWRAERARLKEEGANIAESLVGAGLRI